MRFNNKTVVVTGAASGLGREACRIFAAEGARLVVVDLAEDLLLEMCHELGSRGAHATPVIGDASLKEVADRALRNALDLGDRIDVLVNNAGINPTGTIADTDEALWDRTLDVNLRSAYLFCHAAIPLMVERGGGVIVNTASIAGQRASVAEAAYGISKAGMIMLSRTIARDFASKGIRCNALCPGVLETVMADRRTRMTDGEVAIRSQKAAANVPMGRLGRYEEVARSLVFLASEDASYVNGAQLTVDGALTA
jgi:NAD(P)-dependent dehydrogenase (short-subunit alcohol dehydrogenase family)